ncbi:MAG: TIR domain-containing protein [Vicinamibacterales bacterium]
MGAYAEDAAVAAKTGTEAYDAFLSYPSSEQKQVARIQRFLESYRTAGRRLRVFFDYKDIRGGELTAEIQAALARSRTLIVCQSPAAVDSFWMGKEIRLFRQLHGDTNIAIALLSGDAGLRCPDLDTLDCRRHDLRRGWFMGARKARTRLELLRLLALVSDVDLRTLRNWDLRQRLRTAVVTAGLALLPSAGVALLPIDDWQKLNLTVQTMTQREPQPLYVIGAEADGEVLRVASRFRAPGPQGFRDYIRNTEGRPDQVEPKSPFEPVQFKRRLLPPALLPFNVRARIPSLDTAKYTSRKAAGQPFVGEPAPGRYVTVQPVALTDEEEAQWRDAMADVAVTLPMPVAKSSLVAVWENNVPKVMEVDGLTPRWQEQDTSGPTSPANGLAIAWNGNELWLGVPGRDAESDGGLWHSLDGGMRWTKIDAFLSVSSVDVSPGGTVTVTETHFNRWRGPFLEPYASRVLERLPGAQSWTTGQAPPFGTRSEVEFCGYFRGEPVIRVDEALFVHRRVALWRELSG